VRLRRCRCRKAIGSMRSVTTTSAALRRRMAAAAGRVRRMRLCGCPACHAAVRGDDRLALIHRRLGHAECAAIPRDRRRRPSLRVPRILPPLVGG
jgi:hypothetical protein